MSFDSSNLSTVCIGSDVKDVWILLKHAICREGSTICREGHGKVLLLPVCVQINGISTCRNSKAGISRYLITCSVCLSGPALKGLTSDIEVIIEVVDFSTRANRYGTASVSSNAVNDRDAIAIMVPNVKR